MRQSQVRRRGPRCAARCGASCYGVLYHCWLTQQCRRRVFSHAENGKLKANIKAGDAELRKAATIINKSRDMQAMSSLIEEKESATLQLGMLKQLLHSNAEELERYKKLIAEGASTTAQGGASTQDKQVELRERLAKLREEMREAEKYSAECDAALAAAVSANEAATAAAAAAAAAATAAEAATAAAATTATTAAPTDAASTDPAAAAATAEPPSTGAAPTEGSSDAPAPAAAPGDGSAISSPAADVVTPEPTPANTGAPPAPAPVVLPTADLESRVSEARARVATLRAAVSAAEDEAEDSASAAVKQTRLRERAEREAKEKVAAMESALEAKIREVAALQEAAGSIEAVHAHNLEVRVCRAVRVGRVRARNLEAGSDENIVQWNEWGAFDQGTQLLQYPQQPACCCYCLRYYYAHSLPPVWSAALLCTVICASANHFHR